MRYFDSSFLGVEGSQAGETAYSGSRYADVEKAVYANAYYVKWGSADEPGLPVYEVTLGRLLAGLLSPLRAWQFRAASKRAIESPQDLRWGPDGRGYRRLLHPNGVCLFGTWQIDDQAPDIYTGYFGQGRKALLVARYSTCCTRVSRRGYLSLSLVGKLFPTCDPDHLEPLPTANFITQQDLGGERTTQLASLRMTNAPSVHLFRRGLGFPILLLTGLVFRSVDRKTTVRQLYPIAELGKDEGKETRAPLRMQLAIDASNLADDPGNPADDFRAEVLDHFHVRNQASLSFDIRVSDASRPEDDDWCKIGRMTFTKAVASYNGDHVLHFTHPRWRDGA